MLYDRRDLTVFIPVNVDSSVHGQGSQLTVFLSFRYVNAAVNSLERKRVFVSYETDDFKPSFVSTLTTTKLTLFLKKTHSCFRAQDRWYTDEQRSLKHFKVAPFRLQYVHVTFIPCWRAVSTFTKAPLTVSYTPSDHNEQFKCAHLSTS